MPKIRHDDGQYALDCYVEEPEDDKVEPSTEFSDDRTALEKRAKLMLSAGRYQYLELYRWDAEADEWECIEVYEPD